MTCDEAPVGCGDQREPHRSRFPIGKIEASVGAGLALPGKKGAARRLSQNSFGARNRATMVARR
jgi:hypothetical protein